MLNESSGLDGDIIVPPPVELLIVLLAQRLSPVQLASVMEEYELLLESCGFDSAGLDSLAGL
jgi:hypothetical protein